MFENSTHRPSFDKKNNNIRGALVSYSTCLFLKIPSNNRAQKPLDPPPKKKKSNGKKARKLVELQPSYVDGHEAKGDTEPVGHSRDQVNLTK